MIRRCLRAAALALLMPVLGAAPPAAVSPGPVRHFSALNVDERLHLPDSTMVTVGKRTATLGVLRAEHVRRKGRLAAAKATGTFVASTLASATIRNSIAGGGLGSLSGELVVEPPAAYSGDTYGPYANDVRAFCKAAQATLCLYYPAQTTFWLNQGTHDAEDNDPFITDPSICTSEGGIMINGNCDYIYPAEHKSQFNPGPKPFTYQADCDSDYWKLTVDPHGAIVAKPGPKPFSSWYWSTGSSPVSCVVRAYVQT